MKVQKLHIHLTTINEILQGIKQDKVANTARVVSNKDKTEKLRRQLIFTLQDEEIPTEERYEAIVRLYELLGPSNKSDFCRTLGIDNEILNSAFKYSQFLEEEPEISKW